MKRAFGFIAALGSVFAALGTAGDALLLFDRGVTRYRIVVSAKASRADLLAAQTLQTHFYKVSETILPIDTDEGLPRSEEILIGRSRRSAGAGISVPEETLGEDGFLLKTIGPKVVIIGGAGRGVVNGVYSFLEDCLGCRKYAAGPGSVPRRETIAIEPLDRVEVPAFSYREVHMPDAFDEEFADWHKLHNRADQSRDWGLWVHTFGVFVPAARYFAAHPEYFTETNGIRVPNGQLCLSHPDVLGLVIEGLKERVRANPAARYWSVSQNDTFLPCQCERCRDLEARYGGPSGAILWFVNQVARAFPDKVISTLAYQYSRPAPAGLVPEPNVNIMLCTIELNRSRPIASDPGSASFLKDLRDWGRLTRNILIWDYVVQFRNYCDPFPNLRVLKPNLKLFADAGVKMVFEQGSGRSRSEFHELRTYLLAKLLWNPDADVEALTEDFVRGFYGPAAGEILGYLDSLHDALDRSGGDLGIYGYPWDGIQTYLRPDLIGAYAGFFDRAEAAVADVPELLDRIRTARLPLEFARLEISKRNPTPELSIFRKSEAGFGLHPDARRRLGEFVEQAGASGFRALDETGTSPADYQSEMERFFAEGAVGHLGLFKNVRTSPFPNPKYPVGGSAALTDGLKGTLDYHCNWAGFEGEEMDALIDLGEIKPLKAIRADFLQDINSWTWVPREVAFGVSKDGAEFREVGFVRTGMDEKRGGTAIETFAAAVPAGVAARFIRVKTKSFLLCPPWHKGAGGKAWIFIDEIIVD
jgi:hypothetical protein